MNKQPRVRPIAVIVNEAWLSPNDPKQQAITRADLTYLNTLDPTPYVLEARRHLANALKAGSTH